MQPTQMSQNYISCFWPVQFASSSFSQLRGSPCYFLNSFIILVECRQQAEALRGQSAVG